MQIRVKLFAVASQLAGQNELVVEVDDDADVAALRKAVTASCPTLAPLVERGLVAVDAQYARDEIRISPTAEIALIPPVSGG